MMRNSIKGFLILLAAIYVFSGLVIVPISYAQSDSVVYITKSGKKYHYRNCKTIARSAQVYKTTIQNARKQGYTACKVCKPR